MTALTSCLLYLTCVAAAQKDTSAPDRIGPEVGWQNSPGRRGTLDIVLSCATTIFACTWSIQHLNVPGRHDTFWTNLGRSAKWMVITILLPEFILAHAVFELDMAIKAKRILNNKSSDDSADPENSSWKYIFSTASKVCKSTASNISRFCKLAASRIQSLCGKKEPSDPPPESAVEDLLILQPQGWTLTHCYFANMGGLYYQDNQSSGLDEAGRNIFIRFPLTAFQYAEHREALNLPDLSEDSIKDKSKQDVFAKIVALFQISSLVLSIGVRRGRGLPYTQLEVVTLGFAVCGIVTYFFYWYKPQGVKVAIDVTPKPLATNKPNTFQPKQESFWKILKNRKTDKERFLVERIHNDNISAEPSESTHAMIPVLSALSAAFNCIHLLGWNAKFPTRVEGILWQTFLICSIIVPAVGLSVVLLSQITLPAGDPRSFVGNCSRVLQEMAWYHSDHKQVQDAQDALEKACHSDDTNPERKVHFSTIFPGRTTSATLKAPSQGQGNGSQPSKVASDDIRPEEDPNLTLRGRVLAFVSEGNMPQELAKSFPKDFERLANHLEGRATKKLMENAKTFVFPRRSLVPNSLNLAVLYITSILYAASRLAILGLALSSLRSLPEGVYVTTWTKNIPSFH